MSIKTGNTEAICHATNADGRKFAIRIVRPGDFYGLNDALLADQVLVEFYDATHAGLDGFDAIGQFCSRHELDTFNHINGWLSLVGYLPAWQITAENVAEVQLAVADALES